MMAVYNLHTRRLPVSSEQAGALIDTLAGANDRLWPHDAWPAMRFDRALGIGAVGGHGPIRYIVVAYVPGRWIRFRFTAPRGVDGFHEFTAHGNGTEGSALHHVAAMRLHWPAKITWPLLWRPLHNALLEDCLDRAERTVSATVRSPARWSPYVRLLRGLATRAGPAFTSGRTEESEESPA